MAKFNWEKALSTGEGEGMCFRKSPHKSGRAKLSSESRARGKTNVESQVWKCAHTGTSIPQGTGQGDSARARD